MKGRKAPDKTMGVAVAVALPKDPARGCMVLLVGDYEIPVLPSTARLLAGSLLRCAEQIEYELQLLALLTSGEDPLEPEGVKGMIHALRDRIQGEPQRVHMQDLTEKPPIQSA